MGREGEEDQEQDGWMGRQGVTNLEKCYHGCHQGLSRTR